MADKYRASVDPIEGHNSMLKNETRTVMQIADLETFLRRIKSNISKFVKHPQTNGKLEKWNDTYELNRFRFENFDKFVNWYNTVRFHEFLDMKWYLQTPYIAFWSRLPEGCKLGMFMNQMETELNGLRRI